VTRNFGARLRRALDERGPLCVGIDPHAALLSAWGLADDAAGLERFALTVIDALAHRVAVLKCQSAFYERHGAAGIAILERTIAATRAAGALVLLDAKRGDIGSTAQAYAEAYLDPRSPLRADAVTVSPYLGFESLRPFLEVAAEHGNGVFVLALTSNPEGAGVQRARTDGGLSIAGSILAAIATENAGACPLGSLGAVIGATIGAATENLDINGPLLAPGMGAQGARPEDLPAVFDAALPNVIPSYSRSVLAAGPDIGRLRDAAEQARDACAAVLTGKLGRP
jgi:orotidine 5'-phosphate decarboxylase subfamily 2